MEVDSRGSPFQRSKPTDIQQLYFMIPLLFLPVFSQGEKKNYPLELRIKIHTSPLHWFLLFTLHAIRPLLYMISIPNYYCQLILTALSSKPPRLPPHGPRCSDVSIY